MENTYTLYFDRLIRHTEKAALIDVNGLAVWMPKSLCKFERNGDNYRVTMPAWLFFEKGFNCKAYNGREYYTFHKN